MNAIPKFTGRDFMEWTKQLVIALEGNFRELDEKKQNSSNNQQIVINQTFTGSNIFTQDVEIDTPDTGVILTSQNGTKFRLKANNDGSIDINPI